MRSSLQISVFKAKLKKRRTELNMTQNELHQKTQISVKTINSWERNGFKDGSGPKASNIVALCNALNCSFEYLFSNDEETPPTETHALIEKETGLSTIAIDTLQHIDNADAKTQVNRFLNDLMTDSDTLCSLAISYCMYKDAEKLFNNASDMGGTTYSGKLQYQKADGSIIKVPATQAAKYMKMDLGYEFLNFVSKKD